MYLFEFIKQTKGVTPAQGYNGPPPVEVVKYVTFCDKNACFLHGVEKLSIVSTLFFLQLLEEIKTSPHNPFPELQATLVHLPYGMKLIVHSLAKPPSPIICGHLRAWKKQSRCVKITNRKAGSRMNARRLALSVIQLPRMAVCLHKQ